MENFFVDTSAHYALVDRNDPAHGLAREFLEYQTKKGIALITSNFIISEAYTLIMGRLGRPSAISYIERIKKDELKGLYSIERISLEDEREAWDILITQEKKYSYVDATSFALMKRLGLFDAFTFDNHFKVYGFNRWP